MAQIYRFRQSKTYQRQHLQHQKTQATQVNIGERKKPVSQGEPGYLRIDTVQGDLDKEKGVYHINAVDEVTQFEVVTNVVAISERFLLPVEQLLRFFPFEIKGFHSDNGSEYINYPVAELLAKLHIRFTKSRSRPPMTMPGRRQKCRYCQKNLWPCPYPETLGKGHQMIQSSGTLSLY
ncbi:MAG: transposase family protein [Thiolinea sp.]